MTPEMLANIRGGFEYRPYLFMEVNERHFQQLL